MRQFYSYLKSAGLALLLSVGWSAFGAAAAPAAGPVVLTIVSGGQGTVVHDLDMATIESLPHHTVATSTPWTDGIVRFEGVLIRDLFAQLGIEGSVSGFAALNDYRIEIATSDFDAYDVLLAYKRDGDYMPLRDKGPLWVIYPLDQHRELGTETHAKMIWQVRRVVVD